MAASGESPVSLAGAACAAVGAFFYLLARGEDSRANHLAAARPLARLDEALALEAAAALPLLVALRGRADATNPKQCELSDGAVVAFHHGGSFPTLYLRVGCAYAAGRRPSCP